MEIHELPYYAEKFGYIGIFIYFISLDQFTPIPNEISLFTIGLFCAEGIMNPFIAGLVSFCAFVSIDLIYYYLIRTGNKWFDRFIHKKERPILNRVTREFNSNFPKWAILLCFIPRMRFWSPIVSGIINIPLRRFLTFDGIGLLIFTVLYLSSGVIIHKGVLSFIPDKAAAQNYLIIGVIVVSVIFLVAMTIISNRRKEQPG